MNRVTFGVVPGVLSILLLTGVTHAQPFDHEQCYKIKDPVKLSGIVDMDAPQFNLEPGCKIGKAKFFCAPAEKTFVSATDKATGLPIAPLPLYAPDATVDRICYKAKCPEPVPPPDTNVTDQFGNRTLAKFKTSMICTPAVKGPGFCGNGVIDPGEACDTPALGACPGTCESDCTCTCPTACCYVELPAPPAPPPGESECFEYTGTPAQVAAFMASCTLGGPPIASPGSLPFGPAGLLNSAVPGPCAAPGPITGIPCIVGPPTAGNLHFIPADSSCP